VLWRSASAKIADSELGWGTSALSRCYATPCGDTAVSLRRKATFGGTAPDGKMIETTDLRADVAGHGA